MRPLVEFIDVEQSFRTGFWLKRVAVLRDVSLTVPERSVLGLLGSNGAGKTTLLHLLVGLTRPAKGRVLARGIDAASASARARVGYLPERPYFHGHLTGEGLLRYCGALSGMGRADLARRIPEVLATVGLEAARAKELRRYSKGMLQRIGIAQAILHEPELLVLDEPMSGLDPEGREEMRALIRKASESGGTVVFSSHSPEDVEALCDRVIRLEHGRIAPA